MLDRVIDENLLLNFIFILIKKFIILFKNILVIGVLFLGDIIIFMDLELTIFMIALTYGCLQQIIFTFFLFDWNLFDNILMTMCTATALQKVIAVTDTAILIWTFFLNLSVLNLVIIFSMNSNLGHCALPHLHLLTFFWIVNHHWAAYFYPILSNLKILIQIQTFLSIFISSATIQLVILMQCFAVWIV